MLGLLARAFDDRRIVFVDDHALCAAEILQLHVFKLDAEVFGDRTAAGQCSRCLP